jgi:hypothetical protein
MAHGIPLARPASRRTEEEMRPISADPEVGRPASVGVVMVGEAVGGVAVGKAVGAGEVGASASAGRIGVFIGDRLGRLAGILGGMALTGMPRGRLTLTIPTTATTGLTIRRPTDRNRRRIRPMTATRRRVTRHHQTRTIAPTTAPAMMTAISISTPDRVQAITAQTRIASPRSPKLRRTVRLPLIRRVPQG